MLIWSCFFLPFIIAQMIRVNILMQLTTYLMLGWVAVHAWAHWPTFSKDWRRWRHRAEARRHEYKMCSRCYSCLTGHPDEGVCPECGATYEISALKEFWKSKPHRLPFQRLDDD